MQYNKFKLVSAKLFGLMLLFISGSLVAQVSSVSITQSNNKTSNTNTTKSSIVQVENEVPFLNALPYLNSTYNSGVNDNFVLLKTELDEIGYSHHKYQQVYKGLNVEGSTVTLHVKDGYIKSSSGNFRKVSNVNTAPKLSNAQGLTYALTKVDAERYIWENSDDYNLPVGELVVFTEPISGKNYLAYKYDIYADQPVYRAYIFVEANTGEILFENSRIHFGDVPASGASLYQGTVSFTADQVNPSSYRLRQTANGNGIETYSANNQWDWNTISEFTSPTATGWTDKTGVQAHWGAEKTHGYYMAKHGRNSFDNAGGKIKSYVHFGYKYVNAFWDGTRMTYGDGDSTVGVGYSPLVSLDIVGHEITHGVTSYSANLVYAKESGALNESFSDIFGEAIEKYGLGSNNWQLGTEIGVNGSGAIRSMDNPNAFGDPDTYGGSFWVSQAGCVPAQGNDYCGVHTNSGVQNKWFYILSEGESGTNDKSDAYSVTGIGMDKAAAIAYRNLTVYLTTSSDFYDARAGAIQSAIDLYGAGSAEEIATTNAWYAVGVGTAYGVGPVCPNSVASTSNTATTIAFFGYYFDVDAINSISINGFMVDFYSIGSACTDSIEVWTISGTHVGNDLGSLAGWTYMGNTTISTDGLGSLQHVGLSSSINVAAGSTQGFALINRNGINTVNQSCGLVSSNTVASVGDTNAYNTDLVWKSGPVMSGDTTSSGSYLGVWGEICYELGCTTTNTIKVGQLSQLFQSAGANQPNTYYYGLSRAMGFRAKPTGGVGPYTYSWSNSMGYNIGANTTRRSAGLIYPSGPSWMIVEITDVGSSCTIKDSVYVDYVDFTCNPPGLLWYYQLCNNVTNQSVCVKGYWNMIDSLNTGNYTFGTCPLPKTNHVLGTESLSVNIFPNPSDGTFKYEISGATNTTIHTQVLDINGRVLYSEDVDVYSETTVNELNLSDLSTGVYIINVSSDTEQIVKRIIIK